MIKNFNIFITCLLFSLMVFLCSCYLYEYEIEEEAHSWSFIGLESDSSAVVKVTLEQWGTIHDNHLMGWDDDFHDTKNTHYYTIGINNYRISELQNYKQNLLPLLNSTDQYTLQIKKLVDYSTACALILQDKKKKNLDTLEIDHCPKEDSEETPKFVGSYLKINNLFFKIEKGKFPTQKPAYKVEQNDRNIKFTDINGKFIIYGGEP